MTTRTTTPPQAPPVERAPDRQIPEDEPSLLVDELGKSPSKIPAASAHTLAAVIPAYNESLVIGSVVLQALRHVDRVIVVDDGSKDTTAEIARLAGAEVIVMPKNGGKAHAMMAGFARAKDLGYETVVMLDGDGQHNPNEIPIVAAPVLAGEADLVIGSRFLDIEADIPKYRVAGQKILNTATSLSCDFKSTDSQSGYRALNKKALENLNFISEGYNIESDMITHFASLSMKIAEVPISVTYEVPHKHKKHPVSHGLDVLTNIVGAIGYKRPILLFGFPGISMTIIGLTVGFMAFSEYYAISKFPYALTMVSALFLIMGMLLVTSGLIMNSILQIICNSQASHNKREIG